jgi:hypothetical protein
MTNTKTIGHQNSIAMDDRYANSWDLPFLPHHFQALFRRL